MLSCHKFQQNTRGYTTLLFLLWEIMNRYRRIRDNLLFHEIECTRVIPLLVYIGEDQSCYCCETDPRSRLEFRHCLLQSTGPHMPPSTTTTTCAMHFHCPWKSSVDLNKIRLETCANSMWYWFHIDNRDQFSAQTLGETSGS